MFQVSERHDGVCFLCPETEEVVSLMKNGKPVEVCRKCLWAALKGKAKKSKKKESQEVTEVPVQ